MAKTAAVFSGQGSQYPGMGKPLFDGSAKARAVYECAGDILGYDIAKISFEGPDELLSRTINSQPAIFALSMAAFLSADFLPEVSGVAGHSLGEFAALCAAGAYTLEDGFRIIKARAEAMEDASKDASGAMFAVIGSDEATIASICAEADGFVEPVNFNLPNQTVISGEEKAVAAAAEKLSAMKIRAVRLNVSSAFHTKMMAAAAERFKSAISGIKFGEPSVPFYSNLTGGRLVPEDFSLYFAEHMVSPVRFVEQVRSMNEDGITRCVEFGPGKTVSAFVKKNCRSMAVCNVEDMETLENLKTMLEND